MRDWIGNVDSAAVPYLELTCVLEAALARGLLESPFADLPRAPSDEAWVAPSEGADITGSLGVGIGTV
jgi:hypothetical protein